MKSIKNIRLKQDSTIKEALEVIDNAAMQIAIVTDSNDKLVGTITDGDLRRGFLKGLNLNQSIETVIFKNPTVATINHTNEEIIKLAVSKKIHQIPIVDDKGKVLGIQEIQELIKPKEKTNSVFLMVGGLGKRLRPLTENIPKPMLKIGNKSILETIVERFAKYGYTNIVMCVNYKSHAIKDFFGDGSKFGVDIKYIVEEYRMGTAGALSLLKENPLEPFFVMNGDVITNVNFDHMMDYHIANNSIATMGVKEYDIMVPYGVVDTHDGVIKSIEEKPSHKFFVNAGIYILNNEILDYVPKNKFYDMTDLFEVIIEKKLKGVSFPIYEEWADIGKQDELERAKVKHEKNK